MGGLYWLSRDLLTAVLQHGPKNEEPKEAVELEQAA
jgi:hypothetical protein